MNTEVFKFDVVTVKSKTRAFNLHQSQNQYFSEKLDRDLFLEMVEIPEGKFMMGSPDYEVEAYQNEKPQHLVTVNSFFLGKYPVTQAQWQFVASLEEIALPLDSNPAKYQGGDRPVEQISWYEAVEFCLRLSQLSGRTYRLPSEAEWEYACRANTDSRFHFGRKLPKNLVNNYDSRSKQQYPEGTTPVGAFGVANAFGLYDMHGNLYEWCSDYWHDDYKYAPCDGSAWFDGITESDRIIRGGFWNSYARNCRSAFRDRSEPNLRSSVIGFRVVCELEMPSSRY
jgi:formylglycine-generating enzyme required for sulfatase activity